MVAHACWCSSSRCGPRTWSLTPIGVRVPGEDHTWSLMLVGVLMPGEDRTSSLTPVGVLVPGEDCTWSLMPVSVLVFDEDRTWSLTLTLVFQSPVRTEHGCSRSHWCPVSGEEHTWLPAFTRAPISGEDCSWSLTPQRTLVFSFSSPLHHTFEKAAVKGRIMSQYNDIKYIVGED